jgi:hypothetical protein
MFWVNAGFFMCSPNFVFLTNRRDTENAKEERNGR